MATKLSPAVERKIRAELMAQIEAIWDAVLLDMADDVRAVHASGDPKQIARLKRRVQIEFERRTISAIGRARMEIAAKWARDPQFADPKSRHRH